MANGLAKGEYMHESIKKDAVKYDMPIDEIITALCQDNEELQAKNKQLKIVVESIANYRKSQLYAKWKQHIEETPTSEQVDFLVFQKIAALKALKGE